MRNMRASCGFMILLVGVCAAACLGASRTWAAAPWAKLPATDLMVGDEYGDHVAIEGDTAVVGSPKDDAASMDSGSVYVFKNNGSTWKQQAKLAPSDAIEIGHFGTSVSVSGNTLAVGAASNAYRSPGAAYIFKWNGTKWKQETEITESDIVGGFGNSISISGNTVVVGANGAAYIYTRTKAKWTQQAKLDATDADAADFLSSRDDFFGSRVSLSGNTLAISAPQNDDGIADSGSVYVFTRSGKAWTFQAKLRASDPAASGLLGQSLSISGGTIVAGANSPVIAGGGSVYVFERNGSKWSQQAKLFPSPGNPAFGSSVSVSGEMVVVGAPKYFAYVFARSNGTWTQQEQLTAPDSLDNSFGVSVAIDSGRVVVGSIATFSGPVDSAFVFNFAAPVVSSFSIDNGSDATDRRKVTLNNIATNSPRQYMASETPSFTGANWKPYSPAPVFKLSKFYGGKSIFFKTRNDKGESAIVIDQIGLIQMDSAIAVDNLEMQEQPTDIGAECMPFE